MNIKIINVGVCIFLHTTEIVCQMSQCMIFLYSTNKQKHH